MQAESDKLQAVQMLVREESSAMSLVSGVGFMRRSEGHKGVFCCGVVFGSVVRVRRRPRLLYFVSGCPMCISITILFLFLAGGDACAPGQHCCCFQQARTPAHPDSIVRL